MNSGKIVEIMNNQEMMDASEIRWS